MSGSWPLRPLKTVASVRVSNVDKKTVEGDPPVRLCNYTDVYHREQIRPDQEFMPATATPDQVAAFGLRAGDVIITKDSETADDIGVAAHVAATAPDLVCGYHLAVLRPAAVHGRFLYWVMASADVRQRLAVEATGVTRFGLRTETIAGLAVPYPPWEVQRAIADFLDAETARVDALIAKKRRLSQLLERRVVAAFEEALARSTTGETPLRRLTSGPPQYGATESGEEGPDTWPRYIRITDLAADGSLRVDATRRLPPDVAAPFLLAHDDLLFARSGATVGKAFRYDASLGAACFAGYLIRLRIARSQADARYVQMWTKTAHYWRQIARERIQATIQNVSAERYLNLRVPSMPVPRQRHLVETTQRRFEGLALIRAGLSRQIALLQERRQALITAAVSGDLDLG